MSNFVSAFIEGLRLARSIHGEILNCLGIIERFIILSLFPGLRSRRYGQPTESVLDVRDCVERALLSFASS
jgi:hypothetical protein